MMNQRQSQYRLPLTSANFNLPQHTLHITRPNTNLTKDVAADAEDEEDVQNTEEVAAVATEVTEEEQRL